MTRTVKEIAATVAGEIVGDAGLVLKGLSGIKEAQEGDLTFVANSKYYNLVDKTKASAIICPQDMSAPGKTLIRTENPSLAFSRVVSLFVAQQSQNLRGIHPSAVIDPSAGLAGDVYVGPYAVIEAEALIGKGTRVLAGTYVGHQARIGEHCLIYPQVTVRERCVIGQRVIIHSGTVIGSDGFGFINVSGSQVKIPQLGIVEIQDDVEVGANVTIDRARFDKTVIGEGTKIDNLVQIAHNVRIGRNCIICAQAGISGSCTIEDNVILAGQAGLAGHLTVGEGAVVAAQAGVTQSVPPQTMVSGYPAKPHQQAKRINACVQRLPLYIKTIKELSTRVQELEKRLGLDQDKE